MNARVNKRLMKMMLLAAASTVVCGMTGTAQATVTSSIVFHGAVEGQPFFRAPQLVVANDGSLLAFAENRQTLDDPGRGLGLINVVLKRSTDMGATWLPMQVLQAGSAYDFAGVAPMVDQTTGQVILNYYRTPNNFPGGAVPTGTGANTVNSFVMRSSNNGVSFGSPVNITQDVKDPASEVFGVSPTTGIQLRWQTNTALNGRLLIPAFESNATEARDRILYNDQHGSNVGWHVGNLTPQNGISVNEADVVELVNGDLLMDTRPNNESLPRQRFLSSDGGTNWVSAGPGDVSALGVDTGFARFTAKRDGDDRNRLVYSAPLGAPLGAANGRANMGVWTSYDEGKTFINPRQMGTEADGYSNLQKLPNGRMGLTYETTELGGGTAQFDIDRVMFVNMGASDLEGQTHRRELTHYDGFGNTIDRLRGGMGWSGAWTGNATVVPTGTLSFSGYQFPTEQGRADLINGQTLQRKLATNIDLNSNDTTYLSLLISNKFDTSTNASNEAFTLDLQDSTGTSQASIGVSSTEQFLVSGLGDGQSTAAASAVRSATYFLVAKIVSKDDQSGSNFDQIYLRVFTSGVDTIPVDDGLIGWTLAGGTNENSAALIDRLMLSSGTDVRWSVDEFRIGTTFASVASNATPATGWALNGSGDWNVAANWVGGVPNGAGSIAVLGGAINSPQTIYTNSAVTVGTLKFDNSNSYMVSGQGSLTLQVSTGTASVEVLQGAHNINLPSIFASDTNITVANGATLTISNPMTIKANKTVTKIGAVVIQAPLTIETGGVLNLGAGPAAVLRGAPLLAGGARINVENNALLIEYRNQSTPATTILSQLTAGYNAGGWNGSGISTSSATATMGLGWKDDSANQAIQIMFTHYGDADLNGTVNSTDFNALAAAYGSTSGAVWTQGDFNYDGKVTTSDFNCLAGNFGAVPIPGLSLGSVVPEPASLSLLVIGAMIARRRR